MPENQLEYLKSLVQVLPDNPGVYQYFDDKGVIIYVGKAKNLHKRVASYFTKRQDSYKTQTLVSKIRDIKHIVVDTEQDALLLENNLIKKYQPRYNVLLKDDKSFPWIVIKNEPFPRVFSTRNYIKDGSDYFGPYTSVRMLRTLLDLFRQLYPLRTCKHNLSQQNVQAGKFKVCLEYHIGKCKAPCVGAVNAEEYSESIAEIKRILKGNVSTVINYLKNKMRDYADNLEFERAHEIKTRLSHLENHQSKSTVVNPAVDNVDVFTILDDTKEAFVNYLRVINGSIVQAHTVLVKKKLQESPKDILRYVITDLRLRLRSTANELLLPFSITYPDEKLKITVPKIGDKMRLIELSERNAKYYRLEQRKQKERVDPERHTKRILETIKKDLHLTELPRHIECFDNSNLQGQYPVAACVVFKNGRPAKREYVHFNIKTVEGIDDFASMAEVVLRRYSRLKNEEKPLPQLIIVDGGKGQLSAAYASLAQLGLESKIAIIGIAKKLEEIYFPKDKIPLYLDKNSESLKVIQHARNEAHRFGITFHRNKRSKGMLETELSKIKGIGKQTIKLLMDDFKTVENIRNASMNELANCVGMDKARKIYSFYSDRIEKL